MAFQAEILRDSASYFRVSDCL